MAPPYNEWAYDPAQASPAQLVSTNNRDIDALVEGSHSNGVYVNGSASGLNDFDAYPTTRIDNNPDPSFFARSSELTAYVAGDGGLLYEITGVYTELSLAEQKRSTQERLVTNPIHYASISPLAASIKKPRWSKIRFQSRQRRSPFDSYSIGNSLSSQSIKN